MYSIKLPSLDWFLYGNEFSGSLGTDPNYGITNRTTLSYKVKKMGTDNQLSLVAMCYYVFPWNTVTIMEEARIGRFEFSSDGILIAGRWILSNYFIPNKDIYQLTSVAKELSSVPDHSIKCLESKEINYIDNI